MKVWRWLLGAVALVVVLVVATQLSGQEGVENQAWQLAHMCNGCKDPIPDSLGYREYCGPI